MKNERQVFVVFADEKLKEAFEKLKEKDPTLHKFIIRAINDLKENPDVTTGTFFCRRIV
ncbi:MAG: hypothetical protein QXQ18_02810 [Candidatus Aenigmatarchaeota archaeon]